MPTKPSLQLVDDLWHSSAPPTRCPHLDHDALGCICHSPGCPDHARRLVTDHLSLQLWCLERQRVEKCCFFATPERVS